MAMRQQIAEKIKRPARTFSAKFRTRWRHVLLIDERIRYGEAPNCQQLAAELEVSRRTILRDIDFLKYDLGAPIEYDPSQRGYIYTEPNWSMPSLRITEGELFALMIAEQALEAYAGTAWGESLKRVFDRLIAALPDRIEVAPRELLPRFSFDPAPTARVNPDVMNALVTSIKENQSLSMVYQPLWKKEPREYLIDPYVLRQSHGGWYLAAGDHRSGHTPMFNVSRIVKAQPTGGEFDYAAAEFDAKEYFDETFGVFATQKRQKVALRFSGVAARLVTERQWHPSQKLKELRNGNVELEMTVSHLDDVWPWVLSWGKNVRAIRPKALKDRLLTETKGIQAQYKMPKE